MLLLLLTIYVVSLIIMLVVLAKILRREHYITLKEAAGLAFVVLTPIANTFMVGVLAWHRIQDWLDWADGVVVWRRK